MKRFTWAAAALIAVALITGCGGGSSVASTSPATTPATTTHTAEPGEPALIQVAGYDYVSAPSDVETAMATMQRQTKMFYKNYSVHAVKKNGENVAVVALFGVTPAMAKLMKDNQESALAGAAGGAVGGKGQTGWETISGERVATARTDQITTFVWYHDQTLSMLMVPPEGEDTAHAFLADYLTVANG